MQALQRRKYLAPKHQYFIFETLKLDAGTHTWLEHMRLMEERTLFYGRTIVISTEGTGRPKVNTHTDHTKVGG